MPVNYQHDHDHEIAVFAETNFRNQRRRFGIKTDDRRRHMYVVGKTGMGKTNLLENLVYNDIMAGHGVGIVDPHGDFAERILEFIPSHRVNDVVYFNPSDVDYPVAFNILETVDETHKHLIASGLMGVFKKIWPDVWSARMEYILNNTVLALLDYPGSTLLGINRMLSDPRFRKRVIGKVRDPVVKSFWVNEFARYNERYANEAIAPVQNKVGQFLSAALIRNIVGQVRSTVNVRDIIDSGKIFVMNLAKGRIGEDNSGLIGGMLITKIQLATMERVDTAESERRDFYLYVDEFQNFATVSFANILSEARKYHLNLTVAHQYIEQLDEQVSAAIFGNVGTLIAFRVGGADAETLVQEFTPRFTEEDLVNLAKYDVYLRLMIDGVASDPFSAHILPPLSQTQGNHDKIVQVSRERYSHRREVVEDKIARWSEAFSEEGAMDGTARVVVPHRQAPSPKTAASDFRPQEVAAAPRKKKKLEQLEQKEGRKENVKDKEYACARCGKNTTLTFTPDLSRPIYCKECLAIVRSEKEKRQENNGRQDERILTLDEAMKKGAMDFKGRSIAAHGSAPKPSASPSHPSAPSRPARPTVLKPGQSLRIG